MHVEYMLSTPSMRCFYAHKWRVFKSLREADPVNGPLSVILSFLQEQVDGGHASMLKMCVSTIAITFHDEIDNRPIRMFW